MTDDRDKPEGDDPVRPCGRCAGSGVDPAYHRRFTSGGHDERPCSECGGTGERGSGERTGKPRFISIFGGRVTPVRDDPPGDPAGDREPRRPPPDVGSGEAAADIDADVAP
jgi:hypothetical protein